MSHIKFTWNLLGIPLSLLELEGLEIKGGNSKKTLIGYVEINEEIN